MRGGGFKLFGFSYFGFSSWGLMDLGLVGEFLVIWIKADSVISRTWVYNTHTSPK